MADIEISQYGQLDLNAKLDDTFSGQQFQFENADGGYTSLSGSTIRCQFRFLNKTGQLIKTITDGNGITITDAVNATIIIDPFDVLEADGWRAFNYWYDIEITYASGTITTWIEGLFQVSQDVTKP
jgi:hypothetical protein